MISARCLHTVNTLYSYVFLISLCKTNNIQNYGMYMYMYNILKHISTQYQKHSNMHPVFGLYTPSMHAINFLKIMYKTTICMYAVCMLQARCKHAANTLYYKCNKSTLIWLHRTQYKKYPHDKCTMSTRCQHTVQLCLPYFHIVFLLLMSV